MKVSPRQFKFRFLSLVISVVVYSLKIIGLAPFSVNSWKKSVKISSDRQKTRIFIFSKTGLAHSVLLLVLIPVIAVLLSPHLFSLSYEHESSITRATDRSDGIFCVLTSWIVIANWSFNQKKAARIMNRITEIGVKLSSGNERRFKKMSSLFVAIHLIMNVSLWVTVLTTETLQPVISDASANWFFLIVPSFVIYCFTVEYFMVVAVLSRKLKVVNRNLSKFNDFRNHSLPRPAYNLTGWSLSTYSQLEVLNHLHKIRTEIFEIGQEIAVFFSFPILACVAYSFFSLIINTYYLINVFVIQNGELSIGGVFSAVAWMSLSTYPLSLLFFNVTKTVNEAKLTGRLVHKLLSMAVREEIKTELEHFSLQLLHENFDFTAYGFFKLDFTLLHSMLGATATYLVILIQFQK